MKLVVVVVDSTQAGGLSTPAEAGEGESRQPSTQSINSSDIWVQR